jgi:hypothetical protein
LISIMMPREVAVRRLIELCLIGVGPVAGQRASEYLLALPKRLIAAMAATSVEVNRRRRFRRDQ